ncbi:MAG: SemiSWEET transporter [Deltaproteobacteria bacterium]
MDSMPVTILGLIGGVLTTVSFLPQVVKTWRTRSVNDISLFMYALLSLGIIIWIIYGIIIGSMPIIAANAVTLVLTAIMLVFKIRYR